VEGREISLYSKKKKKESIYDEGWFELWERGLTKRREGLYVLSGKKKGEREE